MKRTVCMYVVAIMMLFVMTLTTEARATPIVEMPLDGTNYITIETINKLSPATQCAVEGNCEETNDICLVDNSCFKYKSCILATSAYRHDGAWEEPLRGGGLHCDDMLFHGITPVAGSTGDTITNNDNTTNNDYTTNNDNTTQNGAVFTIEKKEHKSGH